MSVEFPLLVGALMLLYLPRQWVRLGRTSGGRRRRSTDEEPWKTREPGDPRVSFREFTKARSYIDFIRAAAGSLVIMGGHGVPPALSALDPADGRGALQVLVVKVAILFGALLIQTIRYDRHRLALHAPIFFLGGLAIALAGPKAALFAFILVWAANPIFPNAEWFLVAFGVLLAAFGIFFHDTPRLLVIASVGFAISLPLLAILFRRPLAVGSRKPV